MAPKAKNINRATNIVALLEHKPGPGIYSRLERAVQQLPENVRVQELPGLLKRYKDGIPGWELKAVDLDSVVAGRTTVPRDELLAAVRERSPVFTTREVRLSENLPVVSSFRQRVPDEIRIPALEAINRNDNLGFDSPQEGLAVARAYPDWRQRWEMSDEEASHVNRYLEYLKEQEAARTTPQAPIGGIGAETPHGTTRFHDYKPDGATNYTELVFLENNAAPEGSPPPVSWMPNIPHHWHEAYPQPWGAPQDVKNATTRDAVAHMRFAEQGDALRLLESQSDAHNRNIKAAKSGAETRPYSLEQVQTELDAKRLLLEAARQGKSAVEIASPEWVSESVGMPLEHAQHRYGKVLPSELERAGRKLGEFSEVERPATDPTDRWKVLKSQAKAVRIQSQEKGQLIRDLVARRAIRGIGDAALPHVPLPIRRDLDRALHDIGWLPTGADALLPSHAKDLRTAIASYIGARRGNRLSVHDSFSQADQIMPEVMKHVGDMRELTNSYDQLSAQSTQAFNQARQQGPAPGWRGVISDEMRRRIINEGIPAAIAIGVGTGLAAGGSEAEAAPFNRLPAVDGFREARFGLQAPGPNEAQSIKSFVSAGERQRVNKLAQQIDEAYAANDFKRAEDLEAQREQLVEDLDNRINQATEDAEADFSDWEPNEYEGSTYEMTEQLAGTYGEFAREGSYRDPADLADALRGVFPDTERANQIPDKELVEFAKQAFEEREALKSRMREGEPGSAIRQVKSMGRRVGVPLAVAGATVAGTANAASLTRPEDTIRQQGGWLANQMGQQLGTFDELMAAQPATKPSEVNQTTEGGFDYSMGISPAEWESYYAQRAESGVEDPEHRQFKENVAQVLQQPLIRVGAARDVRVGPPDADSGLSEIDGDDYDRISPAQFVNEYIDRYYARLPEDQRAQLFARVSDKLSGETRAPDDMADRIINGMMTAMTESAPKGKWAKSDPMPQEQLDSLRQQYGDWADSMLTPGSAENFETQRGLELLRTTQDGQFAPQYADSMSNVVSFAKGFVDPQARKDFGDLALKSGPVGRFTKANRDYFGSRPRGDEPPAFRNPDGSSRFVDTSTSNVRGLFRAGGDTSNWIGRYSWPLYQSFAELSRTPVGKAVTGGGIDSLWSQQGWSDWNHMAQQRNAFEREQPVNPGFSPEQFAAQKDAYEQDREKGEAWGAATYPNVQQAWDNVKGVLGSTSPTPKTWGTPLYNDYVTGFFQNTIGNIPSAAIMAGAVATGGVGGLAAGAIRPAGGNMVRTLINAGKGAGRGVASGAGSVAASQVKDLPFDLTADQAVGGAMAGFGNYMRYMLTPEEENALLPDVDPSQMSIEELNRRRNAAMQQREDEFQLNKDAWNRR